MKVLVNDRHDWARKCWSTRGMNGHESARPLKAVFYPSSADTLAFARSIESCVESDFATERAQSTIAGHFFCFGEYGEVVCAYHQAT
jgi:hypothetical protein